MSEMTPSEVFIQKIKCQNYKICDELLAEHDKQIRTDAIDKFLIDTLDKIEFEEKWLMKAKSDNADTSVMFSCLKTFCKEIAKQLKEQND